MHNNSGKNTAFKIYVPRATRIKSSVVSLNPYNFSINPEIQLSYSHAFTRAVL